MDEDGVYAYYQKAKLITMAISILCLIPRGYTPSSANILTVIFYTLARELGDMTVDGCGVLSLVS